MPDGIAGFPNRIAILLAFVLIALVVLAFFPALQNDFVSYDDAEYVTANPVVQRGLTWPGFVWAFQSRESGNWHPLTRLSHMLDCEWFELHPAGHHFTSLVIHAVSTVLVFILFRRMTGALWSSFFLAAFFGLHPLRVESVAWVAERKDVLSVFFWLLSLLTYFKYVEAKKQPAGSPLRFLTLSLLWFACGLMSKPMIVTLPCTLLLLDYWPLNRVSQRNIPARLALLREKTPFFLLTAVFCFITFGTQERAGAMDTQLPFAYRLTNAAISYLRYLGNLIQPLDLAFFYPYPPHWPVVWVAPAVLALLTISGGAVIGRHRFPYVLTGWLWFLGTFVPVIGLVQVGRQAMADRYTYLPSLGILVMVIWSVRALLLRQPFLVRPGAAIGIGLVLFCVALTREQTRHWQNDETLARRALAVTHDNYLAHDLLGSALTRQGMPAEALQEHETALRLKPNYSEAHCHAGAALEKLNRVEEAISHYQQGLRLRPEHPETLYNFAIALDRLGRLEEARAKYVAALKSRPGYADAHYNLGLLLGRMGRYDEAIQEFQQTLQLTPRSADAENNLAVTLERLGRIDEAIAHYQQAVRIQPDYPRAWHNLGVALARKNQPDAAAQCFQEALRLKPDYLEARANLEALRSSKPNL